MNDMISRSALLDDLRGSYNDLKIIYDKLHYPDEKEICKAELATFMEVILRVKDAPAVDAVEVVRCKDCKHSYKGSPHGLMCECPVGGQNTSLLCGDDFCSNGERRGNDGT